MTFYEVLRDLCIKKGTNIKQLEIDLGFSNASLARYKHMKGYPKKERLQKIAEYFNVPMSSLIIGEDNITNEDKIGWYNDDDVKEAAEFLFRNPDYRVLFDATKKVKPEDILYVKELIDRLTGK